MSSAPLRSCGIAVADVVLLGVPAVAILHMKPLSLLYAGYVCTPRRASSTPGVRPSVCPSVRRYALVLPEKSGTRNNDNCGHIDAYTTVPVIHSMCASGACTSTIDNSTGYPVVRVSCKY